MEVFADASLGGKEKDLHTKSVMGLFIALANDNLDINPLHWKAKVIDKVAEDIKTAETLALETAIDDSIYLSDMISEIYSGNAKCEHKIPLFINEDSLSLIQSLYSTKKIKRKTLRVVISSMQQNIQNGRIKNIFHVKSEDQLADIFTKSNVNNDRIFEVFQKGSLKKKK